MAVEKLNRRAVDAAQPTGRNYIVYDTDLKGFGLRVTAQGARSWIIEYRPGAGGRGVSKRRFAFAPVSTLTAGEARRRARDLLQKIGQGFDPLSAQQDEREAMTVAEVAKEFMADHVRAKRKATTAAFYRQVLDKHVIPALGTRKAVLLTRPDIARLHRALADRPTMANRMLAVVSSMYAWAETQSLLPEGTESPAERIEKYPERARERFLSQTELERIGAALDEGETVGFPWQADDRGPRAKHLAKESNRRTMLSPYAAAAIRLLLLTGCRLREILHLRWEHVDFERGMLHLADAKAGRRSVVLNAPAIEVLSGLIRTGDYVIAGEDPRKPRSDLKKPWFAVCRAAGFFEEVQMKGRVIQRATLRIHDLRHSFASVGAGAGMGLPIVGKLLGHRRASTTQRYAHLDADPLRRASSAIGGAISEALNARGPQRSNRRTTDGSER
ncbi:tyrosine-type recombinase/integrase [Nostoc sp. NIES-2111]